MMDFVEANYARDNKVNRYDIIQQGGNDEDQDASQKRDERRYMSDGKGHIKLHCGVAASQLYHRSQESAFGKHPAEGSRRSPARPRGALDRLRSIRNSHGRGSGMLSTKSGIVPAQIAKAAQERLSQGERLFSNCLHASAYRSSPRNVSLPIWCTPPGSILG